MTEFWEASFIEKQTMWGFEPSDSAIFAKDLFLQKNIMDILIPGIGYGRNAKIFTDNGIKVTGIEISTTAIKLAGTLGIDAKIYHGSVADMPFEDRLYDGIFCYALLHLLNHNERRKFIKDCYSQLNQNAYMIFITISKADNMYGKGRPLSKDRFKMNSGASLFFYDAESIKKEFSKYGLLEFNEIDEPVKFMENKPSMKFINIICRKA